MTVYHKVVTIPKNTSEENAVEETIVVEGDILEKVTIQIPSGHFALTGIRIKYGLKQIVPYEEDTWIKGDNIPIVLTPLYRLPEWRTVLRIEAYNNDDTYDHSFYLTLETKYEEEATPWKVLNDFIMILKKILRIG